MYNLFLYVIFLFEVLASTAAILAFSVLALLNIIHHFVQFKLRLSVDLNIVEGINVDREPR